MGEYRVYTEFSRAIFCQKVVFLHRICTSIFEAVETIQILGDDLVMVDG